MSARPFIGTAGWSIPKSESSGFLFGGSHLERYAARMNAAEINSSFYRPHRTATYERWAASVPDAFRFSVKLPNAITHEQRLVEPEAVLDRFAVEVRGLGAKLAVLLVQLPPRVPFQPETVERFFTALRERFTVPIACEPRHPSWFSAEANGLLVTAEVARVMADPPPAPGAEILGGWPGLAYIRLHGAPKIYYSNYEADALEAIAARLRHILGEGRPAWCIFDNTAAFHALGNALTLQSLMRS